MILQYAGPNRWWTGVECVLARRAPGAAENQRAFLSHECRAESVSADPFSHPGNYEYVGLSTWSGNYALRAGPDITGVRGPGGAQVARQDASYEQVSMEIRVSCAQTEARPRSYQDVLHTLQSDFQGGHQKLHMAISYRQDGHDHTLYAPCRYINFPHPDAGRSYLQPISGLVLYEKAGRFFVSYVVTYIEDGRVRALQFRVRDTDTHEFSRVERVEDDHAACAFFTYA